MGRLYLVDTVELLCVLTDSEGWFELPDTTTDTLRASADGYNPTSFSAAGQQGPVVLKRAPVLEVRLNDAAKGEPIAEGEVFISYPSGRELGPFPTNQAGLRIRRGLKPGEIRLVGNAEGYRKSAPISAEQGSRRGQGSFGQAVGASTHGRFSASDLAGRKQG